MGEMIEPEDMFWLNMSHGLDSAHAETRYKRI